MKRRKIILISVLALIFVFGCLIYVSVVAPYVEHDDGEKKLPPETQEGESLGTNDRYQIFNQITRDNLQSLVVTNEHGGFEFYRDNNSEFQIRGHEGIAYDLDLFAQLVTTAGYPLATVKVASDGKGFEEYGLADPVSTWTITDTAGTVRTVRVGHKLHNDDGYYVCLEGREAVYVLSTSINKVILAPIENYISPVIMAAGTQNDFYTFDNFTIMHGEEKFISFSLVDDKDKMNPDAIAETVVSYPADYTSNATPVWETYSLMTGLVGSEVASLGAGDAEYEKFGLLDPAYTVSFVYDKDPYVILFSELGADGYYYASSNINPTVISKIAEEDVEFLSYDLFKWISVYPFGHYITQISEMSFDSGDYQLTFELEHFDDGTGNGGLNVTCSDGTDFSDPDMVQNFRMYYRTLISVEMIDYAELPEGGFNSVVTEENELYSFSYKTLAGRETTIAFYPYSTRRCLVTINGQGEFYVLIDRVEKLITDTHRLMTGEEIDSFAKN